MDRRRERAVLVRARVVRALGDGVGELLEEGERGGRDVDRADLVPSGERVVELLGDGEGVEVPGLETKVSVDKKCS